jgi:SAM-dependent methyltransferase
MQAKGYWESIYRKKDPTTEVSWYQAHPANSLDLIMATGISREQALIDVGGGASCLVDCLLEAGFQDLSVLDISAAALKHAQARLGRRAREVTWLHADVTAFVPPCRFSLWHDRAVFHFLTHARDRRKYVLALKKALLPGGHLILAAFAEDGPKRCSGLPVVRYDARLIRAELGSEFRLIEQRRETHVTPWQTEQRFNWFRFERKTLIPKP